MPEPEQPTPSFEAGLAELETVVKQLESGELPLEKALELFEKGMQLSETCRKQLEEAETKVEILTRRGNTLQPEPFKPGKA
ncbi:MAG TPA: exodeoxyribonuclease VII small subunit [Bryobacteraceae bacterium]|nr:exodeoxyribonuclease VII small subunit [Bryobacteraceae bacterium]